MLSSVVNGVDSDSVDAQLLEFRDISLATVGIGDRISDVGGATGLIVDATNVESVISGKESYVSVSNFVEAEMTRSNSPFPLTDTEGKLLCLFRDAAEAAPAPRARVARIEVRMVTFK